MFETIWARTKGRYKDIMEPTVELAIEIAREGREGCAFGWLAHSRNSSLRLFTEDTR
jgi:hypothetical protein